MSDVDGVVLSRGLVYVPRGLRCEVLKYLHQAHQGTTGMLLRAGGSVWWPGLTRDVDKVREGCIACRKNARSQPAAPPKPLPRPSYPMEMISTEDYFAYGGKVYLVILDRYSGWPVVIQCKEESATELMRLRRGYFCTYGALTEVASDGATVCMSKAFQDFLASWEVSHWVSSAYFPTTTFGRRPR